MSHFQEPEKSIEISDEIQQTFKVNTEFWMDQLPPTIKKHVPLRHLAIPGSHNSLTWSFMNPPHIIADDEPTIPRLLQGKMFSWVVANWTCCQMDQELQQLMCGIRFFDIRLTKMRIDKRYDIFVCYGLRGLPIKVHLETIARFLKTHPSEVVIMNFNRLYFGGDPEIYKYLANLIEHYLGEYTVKDSSKITANVSVDTLVRRNIRVLIFGDFKTFKPKFLTDIGIYSYHPKAKTRLSDYYEDVERFAFTKRGNLDFHVSEYYVFINFANLSPKTVLSLAKTHAQKMEEELNSKLLHKKPGFGAKAMNIVLYDFVEKNDYRVAKMIIEKNYHYASFKDFQSVEPFVGEQRCDQIIWSENISQERLECKLSAKNLQKTSDNTHDSEISPKQDEGKQTSIELKSKLKHESVMANQNTSQPSQQTSPKTKGTEVSKNVVETRRASSRVHFSQEDLRQRMHKDSKSYPTKPSTNVTKNTTSQGKAKRNRAVMYDEKVTDRNLQKIETTPVAMKNYALSETKDVRDSVSEAGKKNRQRTYTVDSRSIRSTMTDDSQSKSSGQRASMAKKPVKTSFSLKPPNNFSRRGTSR